MIRNVLATLGFSQCFFYQFLIAICRFLRHSPVALETQRVVIVSFDLATATKAMDSWGGKADNSISASRHSSWDEDDDGGGVWNSAGPQGSSSASFNSGGWGQSHGGKRGNMKVGNGRSRLLKRFHFFLSVFHLCVCV